MQEKDFELTLEQQLFLRNVKDASEKMSPDQLRAMLIETTRQLLVKNNIIGGMVRRTIGISENSFS